MNIGIIGTRGIPNHYGGFEQLAEYLSKGLVERGHQVTVYNSHNHPYQEATWNGVSIVHCKDPEHKIGTAGQFIYDLRCIHDSRKQNFDIILQLGYTSSSIWSKRFPKSAKIVTNMDGMEWRRSKYSNNVRRFLKYAEKLAIKHSDVLIADSLGIQLYLQENYSNDSIFIPYGATAFTSPTESALRDFNILPYEYNMLIARLEPENSIEIILDGVVAEGATAPFLVVGNHKTKYGDYLKGRYDSHTNIQFVGSIYDIDILNNLRYYSNIYFHGHTVGGTNPSLLEAMASSALICANTNIFNAAVLEEEALYFSNVEDVHNILHATKKTDYSLFLEKNLTKINADYSWKKIVSSYEDAFSLAIKKKSQ